MDVAGIIEKYYEPPSTASRLLLRHSQLVAGKALQIARRVCHLNPDLQFIEEAAMLHDIGIFMTDSPGIGCHGAHPYVAHGYLGREILATEGLRRHGLVCERHIGMGITMAEIRGKDLPLPLRDMVPVTLEERIVCFADKFYSKAGQDFERERPIESVRRMVAAYGEEKLMIFDEWAAFFGEVHGT